LSIATELAASLQTALPQFTISLYTSEHRREYLDDNRVQSRNSEWRRAIQTRIDNALAARKRVLVLDIHSYPDSADSFGVDADGDIPPVVLLALNVPNVTLLQNKLPFLTVLPASRVNDIIVQADDAGAIALLLEFNERGLTSTQRRDTFVALADYAQYVYQH
jgi:hypothetical protein